MLTLPCRRRSFQLFSIRALWLLFPAAVFTGFFYHLTLRITRWKSVSVFLAVCGIFSCLGNVANAIDCAVGKSPAALCLSKSAALAWLMMCCAFLLFAWHPASHAARELLEDDSFAQTWYVFWILPVLFIALNLFILPAHPELLAEGRLFPMYIVICLFLLCLLLLFYALFYLMAASLNRNDRLRQENQFLSMQQARYNNLQAAIAETREARHDLRHHFDALLSLADRKDWNGLTKYLTDARGKIPVTQLYLSDNTAVDSVAGHYALLCQKAGIPCSFALDLPSRLPVPEIDLCLVLSNLLENALEASLRTPPRKTKHPCTGLSAFQTYDSFDR